MECHLKYGHGEVAIRMPDALSPRLQLIGLPDPSSDGPTLAARDEAHIISDALDHPVGSPPLEDIVKVGEQVAIVTSDISRPMPTERVLPSVLQRLLSAGIKPEDITVIFGLGIHRGHTLEEQRSLLGECADSGILFADSNPDNVMYLGHTAAGTPVNATRAVVAADRIVCMGNVEYHYFSGYSGGYKALLPGICDAETVAHNHRMMTDAAARAGILEGNPVRRDIDSVGDILPADFLINVVLDSSRKITFCATGHPIEAHRRAAKELDTRNRVVIERRGDLVVAGAGGHPKDMNLYQAQKALEFALDFARPGAPILLIAACPEGYGNETMGRWLTDAHDPDHLLERLQEQFELGGHKAAMIARAVKRNPVWIATQMGTDLAIGAFLVPIPTFGEHLTLPPEILDRVEGSGDSDGPIYVLPNAASLLASIDE